ncbi:hypothetical protein [Mucilaginibacter pedocola]|uniref:Uncharacterized protein n=1 Tax=Mucilaginibacter pedocola TaxID=1792845 RepID=A0A1S9PCA1_9SPHI|nr:hypothetical protein [Mucilaginibacter pedocola]OOQ58616.1 hypothetical protein BC343_08090 [Mucilaginibacter pedocola]
MENSELFEAIEKLPYHSKCQVQHLVIKLVREAKQDPYYAERFKDIGGLMADDFDAPLKEFHDYMYTMDIDFINKIEKLPVASQMELEAITDEMLVNLKKRESLAPGLCARAARSSNKFNIL